MITVFRPQGECFKAFVTRSSVEIAAWNYMRDRIGCAYYITSKPYKPWVGC